MIVNQVRQIENYAPAKYSKFGDYKRKDNYKTRPKVPFRYGRAKSSGSQTRRKRCSRINSPAASADDVPALLAIAEPLATISKIFANDAILV